ncbi:MAG TPA: NAD(P)-binding domain-containing protein [Ktedonobacterales bacterium]|nr:NAD(P)-binding domain-containing protein [Ktedonobacterales bacterium]
MAAGDYGERYCIIGAGSSGITAAKNLKQLGIAYDVIEREDGVGGNWYYGKPNSSIYRSTHLISSKPMTEYTDFPMPRDYPDYPNHAQILAYFQAYVERFDLARDIQFNTTVERVAPAGDGWDVTLGSGEMRHYRGVLIANGHNWCPKYPEYPGEFAGMKLHSSEYKTPDVLAGRRVLVLGAGNSGCDIACEAATHAVTTFHSTRRGYYYMPKYLFGQPADQIGERMLDLNVPLGMRRAIANFLYGMTVGDLSRFGVRRPDHKLFETHPIINSQMPYYVGHGDIIIKPDVAEYRGDSVAFVDGTVEPIDLIVYATGFRIVFPFMDSDLLNWQDGHPSLFLNVFHPTADNLFVLGLIQPDSGQFGLVDRQAQLVARFIHAQKRTPARANRFRQLKRRGQENYSGGVRYKESTRHYVEIEHHSYRRRLERYIRLLGM